MSNIPKDISLNTWQYKPSKKKNFVKQEEAIKKTKLA